MGIIEPINTPERIMTAEQILAKIEQNNQYLGWYEGNPEHAKLVAALNEQNGQLRALAAEQGVFIL